MITTRSTPPVWLLMTALVVAEITSTFEVSMAFAALPTLIREFGDPIGVSWTITVFFIVSAGTAALFARLGDLYGRRRVLMIVLFIAGLGSLISGLSTSLGGLITGRTLQGVSGAVLPLCLGLMRENLDPKTLTFNIGIMGGVVGVSAGLAFLVAGYILDQFDWQTMFFFSTLIALSGMLALWLVVPASRPMKASGRLDIMGGVLFAPAIAGILLALNAAKSGWLHWNSGGLLLACLALLAIWIHHELRHANPLIDVRLFADRRILLANIIFAAIALGPMVNPQVVLVLAQQPLWTGIGLGLGATAAGLLKQPVTIMGLFAGPLGGRIAARHGARAAMLLGAASLVIAWTLPLLAMNSLAVLLTAVSLHSFGIVILYGSVSNQIVEAAPPSRTSEATGLAQVTRATFSAAGSQVVAALMATSLVSDTTQDTRSHPSEEAYMLAFAFLVLTSAIAFIAAWLLPRPDKAQTSQPDNDIPLGGSAVSSCRPHEGAKHSEDAPAGLV